MTLKELLSRKLVKRGISQKDIDAIIALLKPQANEAIQKMVPNANIRWDLPGEDPKMANLMWPLLKDVALEWIDENKSKTYNRSLLED